MKPWEEAAQEKAALKPWEEAAQATAIKEPEQQGASELSSYTDIAKKTKSAMANKWNDKSMSPISRGLGAAGELAKGIVGMPLTAVKRGYQAAERLPIVGSGLEELANLGEKGIGAYMEASNKIPGMQQGNRAIETFKKEHPEASSNIEALANIGSVIPVGKVAGATREAAAFGTGKGLELAGKSVEAVGDISKSTGKAILRGEANISKDIAKKAAPNFTDGKSKIINDIDKYNLQSTKKGFSGIADNAESEIEKRMQIGKDALLKASKEQPTARVNLDGITARYREEIGTGDVLPFDEIDRANKIREEITDGLKKQLGFPIDEAADMTLEQADKARQLLSKGVFKKGAFNTTDPIRDQIKQDLAMKIRDKMADYVPELTQANREIRDLINIKKAASEADARISDHRQIFGAGNMIAGGAGALIGAGNPLTAAATIGAKKVLESGRGASGLISGGKSIKTFGQKIGQFGERIGGYDEPSMKTIMSSDIGPVYHGTPGITTDIAPFTKFKNMPKSPYETGKSKGFYFTPDKSVADEYAGSGAGSGYTFTANLKEKNTLDIRNPETYLDVLNNIYGEKKANDIFKKSYVNEFYDEGFYPQALEDVKRGLSHKVKNDILKWSTKNGYDAIAMNDLGRNGNYVSYVVPSSKQIEINPDLANIKVGR